MAAKKTRAELREEIVALIDKKQTKKDTVYIVVNQWQLFRPRVESHDDIGYIMVHASCEFAAILTVLDYLDEQDQKTIYDHLAEHSHLEGSLGFVFRESFRLREFQYDEVVHLHECGGKRSVKPAR